MLEGHRMKIVKRDGRKVDYDRDKIVIAISKANKEVGPVKELFATVAPPITVKLIATIYGFDFWQLWRDHKESIGVTSSIFYDGSTEYKTEDGIFAV